MKTKEELDILKKEVETLNNKLAELTEEELKQVTGGEHSGVQPHADPKLKEHSFVGWTF